MHADNIFGDPSSLSTREIKQDIETLPNAQCLDLVGQMRATIYERPDLGETRLGMISEEVQNSPRTAGHRQRVRAQIRDH